jgi:hypothetical protein
MMKFCGENIHGLERIQTWEKIKMPHVKKIFFASA